MMTPAQIWLVVAAVAIAAVTFVALPAAMSALLRHMFTAPHQTPWKGGSTRLRLIDVGGLPAQALNSAERLRDLSSRTEDGDGGNAFQRRDGDVWVVSYVKSGTTWTIGILAALWDHPAAEYAGNLQKVTRTFCPQPELPDLGWGDDGFGHSIDELNAWPASSGRRCFKSHWPSRDFHRVDAESSSGDGTATGKSKFIYVMRNALDQITSHWNQVYGMGFHYGTEDLTFEGGWDGFVEDWLSGDVENGKWFDHVASWYARSRDDPDVLLVRFEELKSNPSDVIRRIADFVGTETTPRDIQSVMETTSFDKMRRADEEDVGLRFMRFLGVLRRSHVRQGEVGSGKSRFSNEQLTALEREYKKILEPLGVPREWVLLD